ncbi:MAG TPA: DNA-directed RNA polymerase subunit D [Candidatus Nanoarchaeia archaeon]|nr:DNA-directed RNA polymerase subunit D [Candidatus Nanoarchaeia archaeon]
MEIELLETNKKNGRVTFLLSGANPMIANLLRRLIMAEVPTMAIEDIEFRKNSSVMYDEMVAHRLGLLPLKTDLKSYTVSKDCTCEGAGCAKCSVKLTLKSKASSNGYVYAEEFESADSKIIPVHPKMPIAKLLKGQALELEATAVLGRGNDHAKWCPALAYYRGKPDIKITGKIPDGDKLTKTYPGLFTNKGGKLEIDPKAITTSLLWDEVSETTQGAVSVTESKEDFIFAIESWGQLSAKEIMQAACDAFDAKLNALAEKL